MMKKYVVKKIENGTVNIEKIQDRIWQEANLNDDFIYPWEEGLDAQSTFKALYDDNALYFRFEVISDPTLVHVKTNNKLEVNDSDRVEIFFRKDDHMNPYFCMEMDANGRLMDFEAIYYKDFNFDWSWPKGGVQIHSEKAENGYSLTGKVSFESLKQLCVLNGNTVEVGLFRGHCIKLPEGECDAELKWISWITPDSKEPDFHTPSSFGKFIFE